MTDFFLLNSVKPYSPSFIPGQSVRFVFASFFQIMVAADVRSVYNVNNDDRTYQMAGWNSRKVLHSVVRESE